MVKGTHILYTAQGLLTLMDLEAEAVGRLSAPGVPGDGAALAPDPVDPDCLNATPSACQTDKQTQT